jgi:hypothetical protein
MLLPDIFSASDEHKEQQRTKNRLLKDGKPTLLKQQEVLQDMEKEKQAAIKKDEEKLRDEAKKIAQLRHKIEKKEQKYEFFGTNDWKPNYFANRFMFVFSK